MGEIDANNYYKTTASGITYDVRTGAEVVTNFNTSTEYISDKKIIKQKPVVKLISKEKPSIDDLLLHHNDVKAKESTEFDWSWSISDQGEKSLPY